MYNRAPNKSCCYWQDGTCEVSLLKAGLNAHIGRLWEHLCQIAVSGNTLFGYDWQLARRWWGKALNEKGEVEQLEFDVVAESTDGNRLLIGEFKWTWADYAGLLLVELKRKASLAPFTKGKRITFVLFLREHPLDNEDINIVCPGEVVENIVLFLPLLIS